MQLMIAGDESPRLLRLASQFLLDAAQIAEAELKNGGPLMPAAPGPTVDERPVLPALDAEDVATLRAGQTLDPRVVFAVPAGTAAPIPPPPPVASAATAPAESVAAPPNAPTTSPAPAPAPTSPAPSVPQVDRDGLPHDKRIHSETPTIKADGRWRARRNLDPNTLREVEAELRARVTGAPQVPLPLTGRDPQAPIIPPPPPVVAAPNAPTAPQVMVPPPPPVVAAVPPPPDAFRGLMALVGPHTGEGGKLALATMKPIHAEFGATGWQDYVGKCRDKIPALTARIQEMLK
jgi:hypothetical protein